MRRPSHRCSSLRCWPSRSALSPPRLACRFRIASSARQRLERHPSSGQERARGVGQRLVSRRIGEREAGPHRIRPPLRAPDVRGIEERQGRRVRHAARERRRQQQRLDQQRPHQLLRGPAVERAGAGALPRVGSHGLPAGHDDAGARERPARRGQERAPPELRESALRHGVDRDRQDAVAGESPLQLADDRLHGGPDRGQPRRRGGVLQEVLRAEQRQPGHRRRHRLRPDAHAGREVVQRDPARRERRTDRAAGGDPHRGPEEDADRSRDACRGCISRGSRRDSMRPATPRSTWCRRCWPAARTRASTSGWSTTRRWRRT